MFNRMADSGMEGEKAGMPPQQSLPPGYPDYQQPGMGPMQRMEQPPMQQPPMQQQPMHGHHHSSNTNTTVVIQQQPAQVVIQGPRMWSTGICSCFDDCGVCLFAICCPCIHACHLSSNAGECCCVAQACPIALRTKIRTRHNIEGSIMDDCCTLAFCGPCAMCQMAREINMHGI